MSVERSASQTLRYSVALAFALIIIGEIIKVANGYDRVLWLGVLFLILSPLLTLIVTAVSLFNVGERKWGIVAVGLIAITAFGMALAFLT